MFLVVAAFAPGVVHVVASPGEGAFHHLVGHPPVAAVKVVIARAALEENLDGLGLELPDEYGKLVAPVDADISADAREDSAETVGPVPSDHEGGDAAAAVAGDGGVVRVGAELDAVLLFD